MKLSLQANSITLFTLFLSVVVWALLVLENPAQAAEGGSKHIGRVFHLSGKAYGQIGDEQKKPLEINQNIFANQTITTETKTTLTLKFRDGTSFSLGPDTNIVLNKFVFNPLASTIINTIKVKKGAFRYTSGFKVKSPRVTIKTPKASIGVRGTVAEGIVDPSVPDFLNIPKGEGTLSNQTGEQTVSEGESIASVALDKAPAKPGDIPASVRAQAVRFIQNEVGNPPLEGTPQSEDQLQADALANQTSLATQQEKTVLKKSVQPTTFSGRLKQILATFIRFLIQLLNQLGSWLGDSLEQLSESFSLIQSAMAASAQDLQSAVSLLVKAADVGLLESSKTPTSPAQRAKQQTFLQEATKLVPDAQAFLNKHKEEQTARNWENSKQSTQSVISGAARVAKDSMEMAGIVQAAISATRGSKAQMANIIVGSALSAKGKTNNAAAAVNIVAAASRGNPEIANVAASSAVSNLPEAARKEAITQVSAAAAKAAPQEAAKIAASVTRVAGADSAGNIAAAVTQVAGKQAAAIASAVTKEAGPAAAAVVAAAVVKTMGSASAAEITTAVANTAGPKAAAAIAAAVTKVAGAASAAAVASAAVKSMGKEAAAEVAAAVSQVAGKEAAESISQAVAKSIGVEAKEMKTAVVKASKSEAVASAVASANDANDKAEESHKEAQAAEQTAISSEKVGKEVEKRAKEAAKPPPEPKADQAKESPSGEPTKKSENDDNKPVDAPKEASSSEKSESADTKPADTPNEASSSEKSESADTKPADTPNEAEKETDKPAQSETPTETTAEEETSAETTAEGETPAEGEIPTDEEIPEEAMIDEEIPEEVMIDEEIPEEKADTEKLSEEEIEAEKAAEETDDGPIEMDEPPSPS